MFGIFRKKRKFNLLVKLQDGFTLENADGKICVVRSEAEIEAYFADMLADEMQNVMLISPEAIAGVRYVQEMREDSGNIEVQIGLEMKNYMYLYGRVCAEDEARTILLDFYHGKSVYEKKRFKPVKFN